jgi:hypothetical protein
MRRIQLWLAALTMLVGILFIIPMVRIHLVNETVQGRMVEVLPEPVGRQVRLMPIYEFPVTAATPRRRTFGSRLVDARFRAIPAPVVPADRVDAITRTMMAAKGVRVFYRANDPEGTAFIQDPLAGGSSVRYDLALGLIVAGLIWWLAVRRLTEDPL